MSAAEEGGAAAARGVRGAAVAVTAGAAEATPTRGVYPPPASAPLQVAAAGSSPPKAGNVDKASSAVAGLLERWPSSAAALLAQTMACPDVSKNSNTTQAGRVSVAGPVHGCGQSDLGVSPSMLNLLQSGAFMHAHPSSLLSAPQGQAAAAALMSQGCTPASLNAADAAAVPAHLSSFPGSDFWGVSALGAVSATSPPFLTNAAAAASLLTAANVDSASLGCCFPDKLPSSTSAREQPQRVRVPQQRQQPQQQQQPLLPSQHVQHQPGCSPQDQQLLSISPILMMMPPGGSGLDASAPGGRVMGGTGEEPQPPTASNPGAGAATVSRESLPKVVGVRYDKVNKTWRASWYDPQSKRRVERKFSVNKLGFINAYNLATECRKLQEKKLGLRDRSGRKQNQQQAESQAASAAMQQISSPTARAAALAGAAFPRFDLHSTPAAAAAAAWEATAPTVSPHMDLSLLGPSLKAFSSANTSSSSSSSSLSMPGAQAAALLPVESLLSLTEQQQQQLQRQHQLQQPQQLQQQQLRQQTCLQQALGEAPLDGQQLQHLGACSDQTSVTPARSASDTSYLAQSIASAAEAERRAEKAVTSAAALGGASVLSGPLSVLSPHLFDLGASRQQQQQSGEAYAAHQAATLRRSFQAFEGENPFLPSSSSSGQQLSQRSSHPDTSARPSHSLYYGAEGHVATVKTPAASPSTPQARAVPSEQPAAACATPMSARRGEGERPVPAPATEFQGSSVSSHGPRESFAEKGHAGSPPVKGTADPSLWEETVSRGEKRRLEQTTPPQQRRTAARLAVGSTHAAGSTPEASAVSQQREKQPALSQGPHAAADGGQQQAHVQSNEKLEANAAAEHRLSVSFGAAALPHVESGRQSTKSHEEEGYVPDAAARTGSSESFVAAFSPDTAPPPSASVHSQKPDTFAYNKLANRRCDSAAKSGRSTPSNSSSYQSAAAGSSSGASHPESHEGNWAPQNETAACRRREMLADKTACEAAALTSYNYVGRTDGPLQQQQQHGADFLPAGEALEESANVESLPSPVENSQGRAAAKNRRNSRTAQVLSYDEKKTSCTRQLRGTTQQCLPGEQQRAAVGRDTLIRRDEDAMCGASRQTTSDHHESQQCVKTNDPPPSRQQAVCPTDVQERGREDGQAREEAMPPPPAPPPPPSVSAGLPQSCAGNAAAPPRRKKQEALLSAASFFVPASPLGGSPFSLAAYALAAAAGATDSNGRSTGRPNSLSSFSSLFPEDRPRYGQRNIFPPVCGSAADCCCGRTCSVLQEAGAGGAALVTRCRGDWCGCRASCGYKSSFWQKSALRGWQQFSSDLKSEKEEQSACGALPFVAARTEPKRFGSLRLPRQLPHMHHPPGKERRGEDEELHANKWHGGECWLPEGASACAEDADVSPAAAANDCSLSSTSTAAAGEVCSYAAEAAVGREAEALGKVEKNAARQNGSKEVLLLVKELLLLLLQSLQEALTSLCKRRGASADERCETDALGDRSGGNDKRGHGWDRRSKTAAASLRPSPEVADSSSNSSTCDSDGTATESSSNDVGSSMTNKEALECAAAVERHTRHVRNAGEMDQLTVYTNLFQACIRTRLVPTELPPLQLMHLLRQLMKAQFTEVNGCRQMPARRGSAEHSPSRRQAAAGIKEAKQRASAAQADDVSASLDKSAAKSLLRGESLGGGDDYVLPKAPPSFAGAAVDVADDSRDAGEERLTLLSPPCSGHSACPRGSYKEGTLAERLLRRSKDDELASVYTKTAPVPPAAEEESSATACRSKVTTRVSQERRASFRKVSASSQATKKTCLPPDLKGSAAYLQLAAAHAEDPSRQESGSQNATECTSAAEAAEAPEQTSARTDQICDENMATGNALRSCSRFRMQPLHEHYTRSRGDLQKQQSREGRASGEHERPAQESACEPGARSAEGGGFEKTRAAGVDKEGSQKVHEQQHSVSRGPAAGGVCTTRQRPLDSGDCPTAAHSSDKSRAEKSRADFGVPSHSLAERKEAESRLALLASEILDEHDEALLLQQEPRWTSEPRGDSGNAEVMDDGLALSSAATTQIEEDNVARHLLSEAVVGDDAPTYDKHEKQESASTDRPTAPQVKSPSVSVKSRPPAEVLRRSSRRSRSQGSAATRGAAASPTPLNARGTGAFEEDVEDVKKVEADSESPTLTSEESSVHVDGSGGPASGEHEEPQSSLAGKTRTCRRARDCRVRDEEAGRAENAEESNTGKVFSSSSYGVALHRTEDSLEKLLL